MNEYDSNDRHAKLNEEDEATVKELRDGLDKLEQWNPVSTPNLQWFQENIELEKKRLRKKQWKGLFAFIFVAVFILSVVIGIVYHQPTFYLVIQLVGIIILPFALSNARKKVSNE